MSIVQDVIFRLGFEIDQVSGDTGKKLKDLEKSSEGLEDNLDGAAGASDKLGKSTDKLGKQTDILTGRFKQARNALVGLFAAREIGLFISKSVTEFAKFDDALKDLSAITGLTGEDLSRLEKSAKSLANSSRQSAGGVVNAFKLIGSAKPELLQNVDALEELTRASIILAEASGLTLPEAATNLGNALNALNLPATESARIINVLAAASQLGAKEIPFVVEALTKFGGVAAQAGIEIEESAAAIEILGKAIPEAATVGTNLRGILIKLQVEASKGGREFQGLTGELERLAPDVDNVSKLVKIFGEENLLAAQTLIAQRQELIGLTEAVTGTNTALEQQAIKNASAQAVLEKFRNAAKSARESIGRLLFEALEPIIVALTKFFIVVSKIPEFVDKNSTAIKLFAVSLASLKIGAAVGALQTLTFGFISFSRAALASTQSAVTLRIALNALKTVTSLNPFGLLITAASAAAGAFLLFQNRTKKAHDETKSFLETLTDVRAIDDIKKDLEAVNAELNVADPGGAYFQELVSKSLALNDELKETLSLMEQIANAGGEVFRGPEVISADGLTVFKSFDENLENLKAKVGDLTDNELKALRIYFESELQKATRLGINAISDVDKAVSESDIKDFTEALKTVNDQILGIVSGDDTGGGGASGAANSIEAIKKQLQAVTEELEKADPDSPYFISLIKQSEALQKELTEIIALIDGVKEIELGEIGIKKEDFTPPDIDLEQSLKKQLAGVEKQIKNSDPYSPYLTILLQKRDDLQDALNNITFPDITGTLIDKDLAKETGDDWVHAINQIDQAQEDSNIKFFEALLMRKDLQKEIEDARLDTIEIAANAAFDVTSNLFDKQLQSLKERNEKGLISDERYAAESQKILKKQAITQKLQALFQIALDTARAIMAQTAITPLPLGAPLVARIAALGAAQAAFVASQPLPFYEGTEYVKHKKNKKGRDTVDAKLHVGERVIPEKVNRVYKDDLDLIHRKKIPAGFVVDQYNNLKKTKPIPREDYDLGYAMQSLMPLDLDDLKEKIRREILSNHLTNDRQTVKLDLVPMIHAAQDNTYYLGRQLGKIVENTSNLKQLITRRKYGDRL